MGKIPVDDYGLEVIRKASIESSNGEKYHLLTNTATNVDSGNSTSTALGIGESFTGAWTERTAPEMMIAIKADQDCTYKAEFSVDGTNIDSTLTYYFNAGNVEQPKRLVIARRYYRVTVVNTSGSIMTYLRMEVSVGSYAPLSSALNGNITKDHGAILVRSLPFIDEVSLGRYTGIELFQKFGVNPSIGTDGNEDIWHGGGLYAGFPTGSSEEFEIVLSSASDIGCTVQIRYLATSTSTNWSYATITTTGLNTFSGVTGYRCPRGIFDIGGAVNVGTVTCRHRTTTANVFFIIPVGKCQSRVCADTIPAGNKGIIKFISVHVNKNNNATVAGSLWLRESGKSPRFLRPFTASDSLDHEDPLYGGLLVNGFADFTIRIEDLSGVASEVLGNIDYLLVEDADT